MQFASACAAGTAASTADGSCDLLAGIDSAMVASKSSAHIRRSACGRFQVGFLPYTLGARQHAAAAL